jgi:hypothetical protein
MLNVVAQQTEFLVAIWSKLPLPLPVHLFCSLPVIYSGCPDGKREAPPLTLRP